MVTVNKCCWKTVCSQRHEYYRIRKQKRFLMKKQFEKAVEQAVKVSLTDEQFATLVSFCYKVGTKAKSLLRFYPI
ncbi:glycoside hydrolase family protein [Bartonella quintana]|uniref:glycoside hydrolase family protein n=1 Tax=Bartonella quintana TaxID=803 RepID=UPI003D9C69F1